MKLLSICFLWLVLIQTAYAQGEIVIPRTALKASLLYTIQPKTSITNTTLNYNRTIKTQQYFSYYLSHPVPAIDFYTPKGDFNEWELTEMGLQRRTSVIGFGTYTGSGSPANYEEVEEKIISFNLRLRYEYAVRLLKKRNFKTFQPFIGIAAMPGYASSATKVPPPHDSYNSSNRVLSLDISVVPRLQCHFHKHLFLDLNMPLSAMNTTMVLINTQNIFNADNSSYVYYASFPKTITLRLGVGYKI